MTSVSSVLSPTASRRRRYQTTEHIPRLVSKLGAIRATWESDIAPLAPQYVFGFGRFLGEYYCDWVAEALGSKHDEATIQRGTIGTMLLRSVAVLRDYVVDKSLADNRYATLASDFRAAASALLVESFSRSTVAAIISAHEEESERLDEHERRRHWHQVRAYDERDLWVLGRKTTLRYVPLEILALNARPCAADAIRSVIHSRSIAVQILDDICDWREDLAAGNITLPLWCAFKVMGKATSSGATQSAIAGALYSSDAIPVLLNLSRHYIARAAQTLASLEAPSLARYFARLDAHVQSLAAQVSDVIDRNDHRRTAFTIVKGRSFSTIAFSRQAAAPIQPSIFTISALDALLPLFEPRPGVT